MKIYFSGIGGVGLGPLAEIALDAGHEIVGSDTSESLTTKQLEDRGITISYDQSGVFLDAQEAIDWFVYTSALPLDHPELLRAKAHGIKISKRDELLAHIIKEKNLTLLAVAGTHGKTTTSGMLTWALQELGVPVSYSIGTTLSWGPSGRFDPAAKFFVYECDEFDRNFLRFSPELSIITSVEWDHPDTYPTEDDYKGAFQQFIHNSTTAIMWQHDADWLATDDQNTWRLQEDELLEITLPGRHNRQNATLVLKALERLGIGSETENRQAITSFPGTNRRFERLDHNLYSDYGHTPSEIAATLQLASELSDDVVLVYQPHQNIRQHEIRDHYTNEIFKYASMVYWLPTYLSREDPSLEVLTPETLTSQLDTSKVAIADMNEQLASEIARHRTAGQLVLLMGAGTIDAWARTL